MAAGSLYSNYWWRLYVQMLLVIERKLPHKKTAIAIIFIIRTFNTMC